MRSLLVKEHGLIRKTLLLIYLPRGSKVEETTEAEVVVLEELYKTPAAFTRTSDRVRTLNLAHITPSAALCTGSKDSQDVLVSTKIEISSEDSHLVKVYVANSSTVNFLLPGMQFSLYSNNLTTSYRTAQVPKFACLVSSTLFFPFLLTVTV